MNISVCAPVPSHMGTFWNHRGALWIMIFVKKYTEPLLQSSWKCEKDKGSEAFGHVLRSLGVGLVLVPHVCCLATWHLACFQTWLGLQSSGGIGWLGKAALCCFLALICWFFSHISNDQAWREGSLDTFLAACTCLTCWPLASAPELSGEKWGALYVTASSPIRTEIWTLPLMAEGLGKVQVWSVPTLLLQGTGLCSGGCLRTGRMKTMAFQLTIPTLSNYLAWGQLT